MRFENKVHEALVDLGIQDFFLRGEPTTEQEFLQMFTKVTGEDAIGTAIESHDPTLFDVTWAEIVERMAVVEARWQAQAYARKREAEYPTWNEVNEAMAEKLEGRGEKWEAVSQKRQAVRAKYPKG